MTTHVFEARHYEEVREQLRRDPIIRDMFDGPHGIAGMPLGALTHESDTPRHHFMAGANAEYRQRGGIIQGHLGAVAEVLVEMHKAQPLPVDTCACGNPLEHGPHED